MSDDFKVATEPRPAHLAEFGVVANPSIAKLTKLADCAFAEASLPAYAHTALEILIRQLAESGSVKDLSHIWSRDDGSVVGLLCIEHCHGHVLSG